MNSDRGYTFKHISSSGEEITIKLPEHAPIGQITDSFAQFLLAAGFHPNTVDSYLNDEEIDSE